MNTIMILPPTINCDSTVPVKLHSHQKKMDVETMDDLLSMEIEQKSNNNNNASNNTINVSTQGLQQKMNFRKDENINYIYCPLCNTPIKPNPANMCIKCLNDQIDISDGISKQIILFDCRQCGRYYQNPQWIQCKLEVFYLLYTFIINIIQYYYILSNKNIYYIILVTTIITSMFKESKWS